jgi:hypothetical protein
MMLISLEYDGTSSLIWGGRFACWKVDIGTNMNLRASHASQIAVNERPYLARLQFRGLDFPTGPCVLAYIRL